MARSNNPNRFDVNSVLSAGSDFLNDFGSQVTMVGNSLSSFAQNLLDKESSEASRMWSRSPSSYSSNTPVYSTSTTVTTPPRNNRPQTDATTSPSTSRGASSNASRTANCEGCGIKFSLLKRRKQCSQCWRVYCTACVEQEPNSPRICNSCGLILNHPAEAASLRVKDLQSFLHAHGISTAGCVEKQDLLDRLSPNWQPPSPIRDSPPSSSPSNSEDVIINRSSFYGEDPHPPPTPAEPEPATVPSATEEPTGRTATPPIPQYSSAPVNTPTENNVKVKMTLESLDSEDKVRQLSARQLKELLTLYRVDFRGCCEKEELLERALRLWKDDRTSQEVLDTMPDDVLCKICMDAPVDCVMLECGHMATCLQCGKQLSECPICRQFIVRVVRTFRS